MASKSKLFLPFVLLLGTGCTPTTAGPISSPRDAVPAEFRAACGRPGAEVTTARLHVVIKHSDCDLGGVTIIHQGVGVTVPAVPGGAASNGIAVDVAEGSKDVSFTADGYASNG